MNPLGYLDTIKQTTTYPQWFPVQAPAVKPEKIERNADDWYVVSLEKVQ